MTKKQRGLVICLVVAVVPVIGWLIYRTLNPKLYRVTILPSLGGDNTAPFAINDQGEIVGLAQMPNDDYRLVLWDKEHKLHNLALLDIGGQYRQFDINNRGQITGCLEDPNGYRRVFLREPDGRISWLDTPAGTLHLSIKLNNRGQIVGRFTTLDGSGRIWLWDPNRGMQDLGIFVGRSCLIMAFNDRSQILGHRFTGNRDCPLFLWDPNNGDMSLYLDTCDLNNHCCLIGWRNIHRDGRYMMTWQEGKELTKLFKGEPGLFSEVIINDANQILCGQVLHSRWERFSDKLFEPWDTRILWDPNKGRIFLEKQLPLGVKGLLWPTDLNNHGCIVAGLLSDDKKRSRAIVMEPIPKRWGK